MSTTACCSATSRETAANATWRRLLFDPESGRCLITPDHLRTPVAFVELAQAGLDPATALHTLIAISHFVTGFVLEEQAAAGREVPAPTGGGSAR